ncbi:MAG TPA: hypothetical protein VGT08_21410 [Terracidiphilus sp.]|nr:hypothetical protein [Terracidiphilus sp.]
MRMRVWAVLMMGLGLGTAGAQNQPQSTPQGQREGIDMSQGANQTKSSDPGAGMDMGHCGGMGHCAELVGKTLPAGAMRIAFGGKSADWTPATLAALPHKTVTVHNEHTKADETYSGVPLMDLLTRLGVPAKSMGKAMGFYLVAVGSDGYKAVYSLAEVNPDVHDATVIVADTQDGKVLQTAGPLELIATGDKRPTRWVRNLVAVRVLTAQ